jgi:excisionase family DNA binding protein
VAVEKLLTYEEVAERVGLRPVTIRMWAAARKIALVKLGRSARIPESEVERIVRINTIPAAPERH